MDDGLRAQRDASVALIDQLIRRGRELSGNLQAVSRDGAIPRERTREASAKRPDSGRVTALSNSVRAWQQDCAVAVNELSGLSKAHWLARAFSAAFLVPSTPASVVVEADVIEIVDRLLEVLQKAGASLQAMDDVAPNAGAAPRRFDFVHSGELRPVLEQAYRDSGRMLEQGSFELALITSCGVLEAILTDALEHAKRQRALTQQDRQQRDSNVANIGGWSFSERIAQAEQVGLIRGGCARLPPVARAYRDCEPDESGSRPTVSERDARIVRQVLHVIMRDLDPGR
jgi:hypothetical protein